MAAYFRLWLHRGAAFRETHQEYVCFLSRRVCLLRAHSNVRFFLGRMSKPLPEKGTAEYYEAVADEPSDFIDEGPEGKVASKATKKATDSKVALQAKNFQAALDEKAAKDAAQKEIDNIMKNMSPDQKGRMLAAIGVVATPVSASKVKYDHETTMKRLIANTAPVRAVMETLKNDYESVHYMSTLCVYWKGLMPLNRAQTNEHVAFMKHFNKERHHYGLPERGVTEALGDLSFDEEAGAGAD